MNLTRRNFIRHTSAAVSLAAASRVLAQGAKTLPGAHPQICLFEKPLQSMPYEEMARVVAGLGFDGIAATVRKGGHMEPERAVDELPRVVETLAKHKLEITELTTDITRADQPFAESILRTAAKLGIKLYRTGALKYAPDQPIPAQLDKFKAQFNELAALNRQVGVAGCYQIHAGATNVGAPVWDLWSLVKDHPVNVLGIAWDIRHATVEGGNCWPTNFRLARPHIGIVYAKDFAWKGRKAENVPLGEGMVDPKFYRMLLESGFSGPINLHVEHPLPKDQAAVVAAIRKDLETLRRSLAG